VLVRLTEAFSDHLASGVEPAASRKTKP